MCRVARVAKATNVVSFAAATGAGDGIDAARAGGGHSTDAAHQEGGEGWWLGLLPVVLSCPWCASIGCARKPLLLSPFFHLFLLEEEWKGERRRRRLRRFLLRSKMSAECFFFSFVFFFFFSGVTGGRVVGSSLD